MTIAEEDWKEDGFVWPDDWAEDYYRKINWRDPLLYNDLDGRLQERVAEIMNHVDRERIPKWWLEKVHSYVIMDIIGYAKESNQGLLYDSRTNELDCDAFERWPTLTIRFE